MKGKGGGGGGTVDQKNEYQTNVSDFLSYENGLWEPKSKNKVLKMKMKNKLWGTK